MCVNRYQPQTSAVQVNLCFCDSLSCWMKSAGMKDEIWCLLPPAIRVHCFQNLHHYVTQRQPPSQQPACWNWQVTPTLTCSNGFKTNQLTAVTVSFEENACRQSFPQRQRCILGYPKNCDWFKDMQISQGVFFSPVSEWELVQRDISPAPAQCCVERWDCSDTAISSAAP